jgi:two-component system, sensor histidine kinase LadS
VMVFSAWQRGDASTRWIAIGFLPVVMGVVPILARNLGLISSGFLTQYGMLLGVSLEIPLLLYTLTSRSMRRRDNLMRSAGLPMEDALTRLPNLRSFINHLHGVITRAARYRQDYGLLIIDLSNEAWFAKEHTREVADQALILLASRLRRISRDVDLVSRIGPNQFAMVIEGPCDARRMANWAARIAAYGQKPNEVLPVGASLKLKITCALMPRAAHSLVADEANEQLAWVIAQADAIPADPRKSVHTLGF